MSKYTRATYFDIDFEGDIINVSMLRIKRADFMKMAPHIKTNDDGDVVMSMSDKLEFMDLIADMLPKYVQKFDGLKTEEGEVLTLKEILDESYFIDILTTLVERLFASSGLGKEPKPETDDKEDEVKEDDVDDKGDVPNDDAPEEDTRDVVIKN